MADAIGFHTKTGVNMGTRIKLTQEQTQRIDELLSQMTLEEKIGQMNQASMSIVGGFDVPFEELIEMVTDGRLPKAEFDRIMSEAETDYHEDDIRKGLVGSLMVQDPVKANDCSTSRSRRHASASR